MDRTQAKRRAARAAGRHATGLRAPERLEDRRLLDAAGRLLLQLDPSAQAEALRQVLDSRPVAVQASPLPGTLEIRGDQADLDAIAPGLAALPGVLSAEPERTLTTDLTPNDPRYADGSMYGLDGTYGIGAPAAWDISTGSTSVVVASIDTGVDYTHNDLYQNIWINPGEIPADVRANLTDTDGDGLITFRDLNQAVNQGPGKAVDVDGNGRIDGRDLLKATAQGGWANGRSDDGDAYVDDIIGWNFYNNTNNPYDDNEHGTHTSGTVAAVTDNGLGVAGVAWDTRIMPLKFLGPDGSGSDAGAAAAIRYAADHGAQLSNNSYGGGLASGVMLSAVRYAGQHDHILVAAAGNWGADVALEPSYPAAYNEPNIISVAATDSNGQLAGFSNYGGTTVDLAAPGVNIISTTPNNTYSSFSGTSMATPHVAGVVALMMARHPAWPMAQVISQLLNTVRPLPSLAGKVITGGIVDAPAALIDVQGPRVISTSPGSVALAPVDQVTLTFSEPIDASTLTVDDVALTGPDGSTIPIDSIQAVSSASYTVHFASQSALGAYTLRVGPDVADLEGNLMDQDRNGVGGEPSDRFSLTTTLIDVPTHFDFGTPTSPTSSGYTQVTAASAFTAAAGFGWVQGRIYDIDRGTSDPITRDLNYTTDGTFQAVVSPGRYEATLTLGDVGPYVHDQVGVYLEGSQVDTVTTAASQVVSRTYTVDVSDGYLTLRLRSLGGVDVNATILGLVIAPDTHGPRVVQSSPSGQLTGPIDRVAVTFSEPIDASSFTAADATVTGPDGPIAVAGVNALSSTRFEVAFAPQTTMGTYSVAVGPDIRDIAGNPMDQNNNGTNGEPGDAYVAQVERVPVPSTYDFGTASSPVASGYTGITASTTYSAARGYGWASGQIFEVDRATTDPITRDLNYTRDGTFAVDVPNGTYAVTLTLGDVGPYAHEQTGISFEGTQVDVVSTVGGQVITKTYTITVADGQLNVRINDLGGPDIYATILGLAFGPPAPDTTGPKVASSSPTGTLAGPLDRFALTFSEPIDAASFTAADAAVTGPGGPIAVTSINALSSTEFEVTFAPQTAVGSYTLTVGPDVLDLAGNPMDQDGDGTNGEPTQDQFTAGVALVDRPTTFDFGTAGSPVASGYTTVSASARYTASRGYGWASGQVLELDRGGSNPLTRDFNYTTDATFAVDLPNGSYNVAITLGDPGPYRHDQMGVYLEGRLVDRVTTNPGQVVTRTYAVTVADGQLTFRLRDLGGWDVYSVVEALAISRTSGFGGMSASSPADNSGTVLPPNVDGPIVPSPVSLGRNTGASPAILVPVASVPADLRPSFVAVGRSTPKGPLIL